MDLCIKLEKITNRTFALNWKKTKLKKITPEERRRRRRKKEGKSRN